MILKIDGHTFDSNLSSQTFSHNTGLVTDPTLVLGNLEDFRFSSDGLESAIAGASASAGAGRVTVSVNGQATAGGGPPAFGGANGAASGEAQAYYADNLHFDGVGAPGTRFVVFGLWNLSGTVTSTAVASGERQSSPYVVNAQGSATLKVNGSGFAEYYLLNPEIARDQTSIENSGDPVHEHTDPPTQIFTSYLGTAGSPVFVSFGFDATAGGVISSGDIITNSGGLAGGNIDFSHTAAWGGITSVTDENGSPIIGWTVTSDTGFDYSQPVPEPSTFVLLAIALTSFLVASRRYRRS